MTFGLRVRDAETGNITLEVTDRLTRQLGVIETGVSNGSVTDPGLSLGQPFFVVIDPYSNLWTNYTRPIPSVSGNTLFWNFPDIYGFRVSVKILYGVS